MRPTIVEHYENWSPPRTVLRDVEVLFGSVDDKYVAGIDTIVLTNGEQGTRRRRQSSMSRRASGVKAAGKYHHAWRGKPAYIELFVDRIGANESPWIHRIAMLRRVSLGHVLFHEIGHHIHLTKHREFADREFKADKWRNRLIGIWIKRQYPVLARVLWAVGHLRQWWKRGRESARRRSASTERSTSEVDAR